MMHALSVAVLVLGFGAPTSVVQYKINTASFDPEFGSGSRAMVRRITQAAALTWYYEGGAATYFQDFGETTDTSCTWQTVGGLVLAHSDCHPFWGCSVLAEFKPYTCWEIHVYLASVDFTLVPPQIPSQYDLQSTLAHEFGHHFAVTGYGHIIYNSTCIMYQTSPHYRQAPCDEELQILRDNHPMATGGVSSKTTTVSPPVAASWAWTRPRSTGINYGSGFGDAQRSYYSDQFFLNRVDTPTQTMVRADYKYFSGYVGVPGSQSLRRPALAYDPIRDRWWMFVVIQDVVQAWTSYDGVSWSFLGNVADPNYGVAPIRTTPTATYHPTTDRIVLAWLSEVNVENPPCTQPWGCRSEFLVQTIPASASTWYQASPVMRLGYGTGFSNYGYGSPVVGCDLGVATTNPSTFQCELIGNGLDPYRRLWGVKFGLDSGGWLSGVGGSYVVSGGQGLGRLSLDVNHGAGAWVLATRGTDGNFYLATRGVMGQWTSWQGFGWGSYHGPVIRSPDSPYKWDLLYGN